MEELESAGARLTVVQSIYYQSPGMEPDQRESRYDLKVENDEQPYFRYLTLKPKSTEQINTAWIEDPAIILIDNLTGKFSQTNPSKEELEAFSKRIIEIHAGEAQFLIPPRDCQRLVMSSGTLDKLALRNNSEDEIKYSITAYPR